MNLAEIMGAVIGALCFLIWIPCMISWIRRGVSVPRYIHVIALATTCAGVGCAVGLAANGALTATPALLLVALPAAATYLGRFWLFEPALLPSHETHS